jgi:hypothetical protein
MRSILRSCPRDVLRVSTNIVECDAESRAVESTSVIGLTDESQGLHLGFQQRLKGLELGEDRVQIKGEAEIPSDLFFS